MNRKKISSPPTFKLKSADVSAAHPRADLRTGGDWDPARMIGPTIIQSVRQHARVVPVGVHDPDGRRFSIPALGSRTPQYKASCPRGEHHAEPGLPAHHSLVSFRDFFERINLVHGANSRQHTELECILRIN